MTTSSSKKRYLEQQEEDIAQVKKQKMEMKPDYRNSNRFIDLINNKHMFSVIHSFIGNDTITAARMRTAFPVHSLNPYFYLLTIKPHPHQIAIKYIEDNSSVQVFVRSVSPDYNHDARDDGIRIRRSRGLLDTTITHHHPTMQFAIYMQPTLQFFMYMRPDALPLNKYEYSETFQNIKDVPSFYIKNAYTFVLDYMLFATHADLSAWDLNNFNRLVSMLPLAQMIFLDNPANGCAWHDNKKLLHPRTKYQVQFGSDAAIRVLDNEYSVYYSSNIDNMKWGWNLNNNQNRARIYRWL